MCDGWTHDPAKQAACNAARSADCAARDAERIAREVARLREVAREVARTIEREVSNAHDACKNFEKNVRNTVKIAINDVNRELAQVEKNARRELVDGAREISNKFNVEMLKEALIIVITNAIPALKVAKYAAFVAALAEAHENFGRMVKDLKHFTDVIDSDVGRLDNFLRNDAGNRLSELNKHTEAAFNPFLSGPAAEVLQMKSAIRPFHNSAQAVLRVIRERVEWLNAQRNMAKDGWKLLEGTKDSWKSGIQDVVRNELRGIVENYLKMLAMNVML
jgi:ABC-type transporter Mla subunit MlaD